MTARTESGNLDPNSQTVRIRPSVRIRPHPFCWARHRQVSQFKSEQCPIKPATSVIQVSLVHIWSALRMQRAKRRSSGAKLIKEWPPTKTGTARLLFQEVITQTLLRSFNSLAALPCLNNASEAMGIFEKILTEYSKLYTQSKSKVSTSENGASTASHTLLEIKAILVATRLLEKRCALILDEPDWGLSREASIALVFAIIQVAHELEIPVILISPTPWWHSIAKSIIHIEKSPVVTNNKSGERFFRIRLRRNGKPQPWAGRQNYYYCWPFLFPPSPDTQ